MYQRVRADHQASMIRDNDRMKAQITSLTAERDRLRDALQLVWDTYGMDPSVDSAIWQTVRATLAIKQ